MVTYNFPAGNAVAVASVGDDGPGVDHVLAAASGVQAEVFADAAGTVPVVVRDANGLQMLVEAGTEGWFREFYVEDYSIVYLVFGDLPPQPHFSIQMMQALPQAQAAQLAAEQSRTHAQAAAAAAELSRVAAEAAAGAVDGPTDAQIDAGILRAIAANQVAPSSAEGAVEGDVLTWDATLSRFVPEEPSGGGGISEPVQVPVVWNGTAWKIGATTVTSQASAQALGYPAGSKLIFSGATPPAWAPDGTGHFAASGWRRAS